MKHIVFGLVLLSFLIVNPLQSQTLIINEVSNGPSGSTEYVEFIVIDTVISYDCTGSAPPCVDIRGWIIDDNSGYHGTSGVASGAARFSNDPLWSCLPLGTIILVYNGNDPNPDIAGNDVSLADGNCAISVNLEDPTYFEFTTTTPGDVACNYPTTGWGTDSSPDWSNIAMANGGDCMRLVDLNGCEVFSLCYGSDNLNNQIYFTGSGTDMVWSFNGIDPYDQANWTAGCAGDIVACGGNDQTPGSPNNAANAAYISQFNNGCAPIPPIITTATSVDAGCGCTGTATATSSGSIPGYTYEWYDDAYAPIGQASDNATGLCGGTYHVIGTSSIGCEDTATVLIGSAASFTVTNVYTDPKCFESCDGTSTLTISGGSTPFSYVWSNSASNTASATDLCTGAQSVTITDDNNCTIIETFNLTEPSEIVPILTPINPKCFGSSDGSISMTITGGSPSYSFSWDDISNSTNQNLSGIPDGTYTVTITDQNNCIAISSSTITEPAEIVPTTTPINPLCYGSSEGSVSLSISGGTAPYSFLWSDASNTTTQNINGLPDGTFSVTITDQNNCIINTSETLIQPDSMSISTFVANPTCYGGTNGSINLSVSGGSPSYTFLWSDNSTGSSLSNIGDGAYLLEVTDQNNCVQYKTITIDQPDSMSITSTIVDANCSANDGQACISITGGATPYSQIWNDPSSQTSTCAINLNSGNYTVTVADNNNCSQLLNVTVGMVIPNIIISTDSSNVDCFGLSNGSITLTVTSPSSYTTTWIGPNAYTSAGDNITNLSGGIYSYTITDVNNCILQGDVEIFEPTLLIPQATSDSISCSILCDGAIYPNPSGGLPPYQFSIDNSNWQNNSFSSLCENSYTLYITDGNNCQKDTIINISPILYPANATITPESSLCENSSSIVVSAQDPNGTWSGSGITDPNLGIFSPSVSGVGTFEIIYTIPGTCGDADTINITVNGTDVISIIQPNLICENDIPINLSGTPQNGTWSGVGIVDANNGTFDPATAGPGQSTVYYQTSGLCPGIDSIEVSVLPIIYPTILNTSSICENDTTIELVADIAGGNWTVNGNVSGNTLNPVTLGTGSFPITYTLTQQCGSKDSVQITVLENPSANITLSDTIGCAPLSLIIGNSISGNNQSCLWNMDNGSRLDSCGDFTFTYNTPGCYDISLTVINQEGCKATFYAGTQVCIEATASADFDYSPTNPSEFNAYVNFTNTSVNATSYQWYIDSVFNSNNIDTYNNFEGIAATSHEICLIAENSTNCNDTICKEVVISPEFSLYVPNTFTPDGDGINESFNAILSGKTPETYSLMIFDRWGNLFFETTDFTQSWDGKNGNLDAQQDAYVWKIQYKLPKSAEVITLLGHVNLLR